MSDIAIRVENLSKQYRIGGRQQGASKYRSLREELTKAAVAPLRRAGKLLRGQPYGAADMDETIWALKDVSFQVERGEVVGIPSTGSGQALGGTGWGRRRLLRQAQYKAQGPLPHHRADGGLCRDGVPSLSRGPRAGGLAAGGGALSSSKGGHRPFGRLRTPLPPRADRAGEHLPEGAVI